MPSRVTVMPKRTTEPLPDDSGEVYQAVKILRDLASKAKIIAEHRSGPGRRVTVAEYLSDLLRGPIQKDWKAVVKELGDTEA